MGSEIRAAAIEQLEPDVAQLDVHGTFGGSDVLAAITGHILAQESVTGVYTLNPAVRL
jgi:phosphatidylethanolamine-binding protein (PEBP) family uncharacterized protein